jgi:hypothetical protein
VTKKTTKTDLPALDADQADLDCYHDGTPQPAPEPTCSQDDEAEAE